MPKHILMPQSRWQDHAVEEDAAALSKEVELHIHPTGLSDPASLPEDMWKKADALVSGPDPLMAITPDDVPNAKILVTPKVGFDNIDIKTWGEAGVPVCNVPDYGTQEVADHAMALMLTLVKGIRMYNERTRKDPAGAWRAMPQPTARRLSVCTFGVVGLGRIGTAAALRAKAFGMDVVFYDPYKPNGSDLAIGVRRVDSLAELFSQSDIVSIHVPLSDDTVDLIDAEVLSHSKEGLILINSARGPLVDLEALYDAMESDKVLAAGLDVVPQEPPNTNLRLIADWHNEAEWLDDRLIITPHAAYFTPDSVRDMRFKGVEVAVKYLIDGRLMNCVNEDSLTNPR